MFQTANQVKVLDHQLLTLQCSSEKSPIWLYLKADPGRFEPKSQAGASNSYITPIDFGSLRLQLMYHNSFCQNIGSSLMFHNTIGVRNTNVSVRVRICWTGLNGFFENWRWNAGLPNRLDTSPAYANGLTISNWSVQSQVPQNEEICRFLGAEKLGRSPKSIVSTFYWKTISKDFFLYPNSCCFEGPNSSALSGSKLPASGTARFWQFGMLIEAHGMARTSAVGKVDPLRKHENLVPVALSNMVYECISEIGGYGHPIIIGTPCIGHDDSLWILVWPSPNMGVPPFEVRKTGRSTRRAVDNSREHQLTKMGITTWGIPLSKWFINHIQLGYIQHVAGV